MYYWIESLNQVDNALKFYDLNYNIQWRFGFSFQMAWFFLLKLVRSVCFFGNNFFDFFLILVFRFFLLYLVNGFTLCFSIYLLMMDLLVCIANAMCLMCWFNWKKNEKLRHIDGKTQSQSRTTTSAACHEMNHGVAKRKKGKDVKHDWINCFILIFFSLLLSYELGTFATRDLIANHINI